jgi:hypothetical protein
MADEQKTTTDSELPTPDNLNDSSQNKSEELVSNDTTNNENEPQQQEGSPRASSTFAGSPRASSTFEGSPDEIEEVPLDDKEEVDVTEKAIQTLLEKIKSILDDSDLTPMNISSIVLSLVVAVEEFKDLSGKDKKKVVLDSIEKYILSTIPETNEIRSILLDILRDLLPEMIEIIIGVDKGQYRIKAKKTCKLGVRFLKKMFHSSENCMIISYHLISSMVKKFNDKKKERQSKNLDKKRQRLQQQLEKLDS